MLRSKALIWFWNISQEIKPINHKLPGVKIHVFPSYLSFHIIYFWWVGHIVKYGCLAFYGLHVHLLNRVWIQSLCGLFVEKRTSAVWLGTGKYLHQNGQKVVSRLPWEVFTANWKGYNLVLYEGDVGIGRKLVKEMITVFHRIGGNIF